MIASNLVLDRELLSSSYNPFQTICENSDGNIKYFEYRPYKDYLTYLKIIGNRLLNDYNDFDFKNERLVEITNNLYADPPERKSALDIWWQSAYQLQLDRESFIIFTKLFLDKAGNLIEKLLKSRSKDNWPHSFTKHKEWFIDNPAINPAYTKILKNMHWYDYHLDLMRNKMIEHGTLAGSFRTLPEGVEYTRVNETFMLSIDKDYPKVQAMVQKYAERHSELRVIKPHPMLMLQEFVDTIGAHGIVLEKEDYKELGEIVKRTGGEIDPAKVSHELRKFLNDGASLFV